MTSPDKREPRKKRHKHRWSKQYRGIFNGPVRVCIAGRCGAIRTASGHLIFVKERINAD